MEASVLDLRRKMRDVISAIDRHEHVTLSYRGRRIAVMVPLDGAQRTAAKASELPAFGMWAGRDDLADPVAYVENIRKPRAF